MKPNYPIAGAQYGQWTTTGQWQSRGSHLVWEVVCACGAKAFRQPGALGVTSSKCRACANRARFSATAVVKNPRERLLLLHRWNQILSRCGDITHPRWKDYGQRGIRVVPPLNNFDAFCRHVTMLPNYSLALTLDRIDNDGNYEIGNLRWATVLQQRHNRRGQ